MLVYIHRAYRVSASSRSHRPGFRDEAQEHHFESIKLEVRRVPVLEGKKVQKGAKNRIKKAGPSLRLRLFSQDAVKPSS